MAGRSNDRAPAALRYVRCSVVFLGQPSRRSVLSKANLFRPVGTAQVPNDIEKLIFSYGPPDNRGIPTDQAGWFCPFPVPRFCVAVWLILPSRRRSHAAALSAREIRMLRHSHGDVNVGGAGNAPPQSRFFPPDGGRKIHRGLTRERELEPEEPCLSDPLLKRRASRLRLPTRSTFRG